VDAQVLMKLYLWLRFFTR